MKIFLRSLIALILLSSFIVAQGKPLYQRGHSGAKFTFDTSIRQLEKCVTKTRQKHVLYTYNISNISTPGFEPILFPEDEADLHRMVPKDSDYFEKVLLEHMTISMAKNKNIYSACLSLYKKKIEIWKQVATLGKK